MKQVIVVNEALALPRGKLAAQVAHGSLAAFLAAPADSQDRWLKSGMPKIVLQVGSESDLLELERVARERGLPVALIKDGGHTVVAPGTITVLGIGPALPKEIDRVTGDKPLVK
jgi:peptidyl-tRNA hydrolase, PTH2 family